MITGIDVSHWQEATDWSPSGIEFVIARATIGTQIDGMYDDHIRKAKAAGLVTGAYHFNHSPISISDQVNAFIQRAGNVDLYALDVEPDQGVAKFTIRQAEQFMNLFRERTNKKIGLYMSDSIFYVSAGQDWNWVANWSNPPNKKWDIWQYGLYKGKDGNRFDGTPAELRALGGTEMAQLEITDITPKLVTVTTGTWRELDGSVLSSGHDAFRTPRLSPYGTVGGYRAIYVTPGGGDRRLVLVPPATTADLPVPSDDTPYDQQDLEQAQAEAIMNLQADFDAYKADEATRVAEAIAADRANAKVGVIYE